MELNREHPVFTITIGQFTDLLEQTISEVWDRKKSLLVADFRMSQLKNSFTEIQKTPNSKKQNTSSKTESDVLQQIIIERLTILETLIREQMLLQKEILNMGEACIYLGLSESYLYKLTSQKSIPHYKSRGKIIHFKRLELDDWQLRNRIKTNEEIEMEASALLKKKRN
ncbi:MAG TPA: helix-turn-helix domain-containing protein [Bacteroidia bacterium]|nr:helix-turn-helix domain-containing protein [Bacteroidia bacterium]